MIDANLPGLRVDTVAGDDVVSSIEHAQALVITGSSSGGGGGAAPTVVIKHGHLRCDSISRWHMERWRSGGRRGQLACGDGGYHGKRH